VVELIDAQLASYEWSDQYHTRLKYVWSGSLTAVDIKHLEMREWCIGMASNIELMTLAGNLLS
jgi:hypothetical protein